MTVLSIEISTEITFFFFSQNDIGIKIYYNISVGNEASMWKIYFYLMQIEAIYFVSVFITFMYINSINYGNFISLINISPPKKL